MSILRRALSALTFPLSVCLFTGFAAAQEPAPPPPVTGVDATGADVAAETTLNDQTDVAVTVYNNNLGLVRDRRKLSLPTGEHRLRFAGVAQQIRPETVSLESVGRPGSLTVLEQNYEFDLISPSKLMEKYVGKEVELIGYDRDLRFERVAARLLSVNDGPIFEIDGDIYLGHPGNVVLPEIPDNLVARPSLLWLLVNEAPDQELELTYLTYGMRWNADYVVKLDPSEEHVDIQGWVTLTNESGAEYKNARLKLVAGDVNVIQPPMAGLGGGFAPPYLKTAEAAPLQQEAFAEYHLYTLPRRTTLRQNQSKQVNLLEVAGVTVEKAYELESHPPLFGPAPEMPEAHVAVVIEFRNEEAVGLGMPLPAGIMRVYQEDREGTLQFAGEDRIEHTPRDEEVRLRIGSAFDIVAEREQTDFQQVAENVTVSAFAITLRNHKEEPVSVEVIEHIGGQWEILESSIPHEKRDAGTAVFKVDVPAGGETVLTYRVQATLGPPRPLPLGRPAPGFGTAPPVPAPRTLPRRPTAPAPDRPAPLPPDAPVSSGPAAAPPADAPVSSAPAAPGVRVGGTGRRPAR